LRSINRKSWDGSLVIDSVEVWQKHGVLPSMDVRVKDGKITSIASSEKKVDSALRRILLPLGVDTQVHLRTLGHEHKETPASGLRAALCGGYGAVLAMPNTKPTVDQPSVLARTQAAFVAHEKELGVRVLQSAALSMNLKGETLSDLPELAAAGAAAFTDDGLGLESTQLMERAFSQLENLPQALLQHAEFSGHGGVLAEGPVQRKLGIRPYPAAAEADMVRRDIDLLRRFPLARYHVLHVSAAETLVELARAKNEGLKVTAEVTPHHLYFSSDQIREDDSSFKMNPPIRSAADRQALRQALASGLIDWVATDHAPHEQGAKSLNFNQAAFGTLGLETSLPVLLELYLDGELSAERVVEVFSSEPARFLGLDSYWASIEHGRPLRAVLVELASDPLFSIGADDLQSLSKNSCFNEVRFRCRIVQIFNDAGVWSIDS
jgi:dihydroorotase